MPCLYTHREKKTKHMQAFHEDAWYICSVVNLSEIPGSYVNKYGFFQDIQCSYTSVAKIYDTKSLLKGKLSTQWGAAAVSHAIKNIHPEPQKRNGKKYKNIM